MKNFNDIYSEIIHSSTDIQNLYKKDLVIKLTISAIFILLWLIIFIFFKESFSELFTVLIYLFPLLILGIGLFFYKFHISSYTIKYKKDIISKIIEMYDDSFKYSTNSNISSRIYKDAEFEQSFTEFRSEDGITGMLNETYPFQMSEVETIKVENNYDPDNISRKNRVTLFHGFFIKITNTKSLPCKIYLRQNIPFIKKRAIPKRNIPYKNISLAQTEKVQMDDSDFEKIYYLESNDKMLTMQLFTLSTLRQLVDFKKIYKLVPEITLKENNIFIRFYFSGELLEPPMYKSPLNYIELQKEYKFINSIINICKTILDNINNTEF